MSLEQQPNEKRAKVVLLQFHPLSLERLASYKLTKMQQILTSFDNLIIRRPSQILLLKPQDLGVTPRILATRYVAKHEFIKALEANNFLT